MKGKGTNEIILPPPDDEEEYSDHISEDDIQSTVGALHNLIDLREQLEDERQEIARLKKEKAELQSKLNEQKDLANSEASKLREDKIRLEGEIKQLSRILPGGMITTFLRGLGMGKLFILGMGAVAAMAVLIWMFSSFHSLF